MGEVLRLKKTDKILFIDDGNCSTVKMFLSQLGNDNITITDPVSLKNLNGQFDVILASILHPNSDIQQSAISSYFSLLHPGGLVYVLAHQSNYGVTKQLEQNLLVSGFINCSSNDVDKFELQIDDEHRLNDSERDDLVIVKCIKPNYEIGSAKKINLVDTTEKVVDVASAWKLDDEDEYIDADDLLNEDDLKKPDPSLLKVCGTTGKRKACKDCSCGLAEELDAERKKDTSVAKSSCGSCYLGDAFRCASCPYLGMPAFKPGEKVQLTDQFLAPDI